MNQEEEEKKWRDGTGWNGMDVMRNNEFMMII
jgi:hypothetical protein